MLLALASKLNRSCCLSHMEYLAVNDMIAFLQIPVEVPTPKRLATSPLKKRFQYLQGIFPIFRPKIRLTRMVWKHLSQIT